MAKRKGSPVSRESASSSQRDNEAKTSEGGVEDECDQLRREIHALEGKRAELEKKERRLKVRRKKLKKKKYKLAKRERNLEVEDQERELEDQQRTLEEQLQPLRLEVEQMQQNLLPKRKRLEDLCNEREVENTQRLDKLPQEMWGKIFVNFEENDLFPMALSCRYFRQKQKKLAARTRQQGPESGKPRLALKTNLLRRYEKSQRPSAEYLRFCSNEKIMIDFGLKKSGQERAQMMAEKKDHHIKCLAAFHGHLPLLQQLLKPLNNLKKLTKANNSSEAQAKWNEISEIFRHAGESSSSSSSSVLF